jgi:calcineurin-like phosphoesterase family protein
MANAKVYVLADLHFGHRGVVRFRPQFRTVEEHDNYIMKKILQTCGKRSTLWLLGDCFFTEDSLKYLETLREAIGTIHLVLGNHCSESGAGQANIKRMVNEKLVDKIHGLVNYKGCWMTHAPIHDSELRGKYCVYGHTHSVVVDDPRYFGVSCEQINYTPVEFNKIKQILDERNPSEGY